MKTLTVNRIFQYAFEFSRTIVEDHLIERPVWSSQKLRSNRVQFLVVWSHICTNIFFQEAICPMLDVVLKFEKY